MKFSISHFFREIERTVTQLTATPSRSTDTDSIVDVFALYVYVGIYKIYFILCLSNDKC